jgi:hypothetical protein
MKIIKDNEELKSYIKNGSIVFNESIRCDFNINVQANIKASDISALNIKAFDISAGDISALNIKALNIKAGDISALNIKALNIKAGDISAGDISAGDISALNIKAFDISAGDISYYGFCISYNNIVCKSIKGRRNNSFYKCLDGDITFKEETKKIVIDGKEIELSLESFEALKKSLL